MFDSKKNEIVQLEQMQTRDEELMKPVPIVGKVDYSGAYEKTDPREIALVKNSTDGSCLCCGACTGSIILIAMPSH